MSHIAIISSSVRTGRASHRVALFLKGYIEENKLASVEIIDLNEYQFPVFDERLRLQSHPTPLVQNFAAKIREADGIIIVTPEYNGGYPASLKNVIDLLYDEWYRKTHCYFSCFRWSLWRRTSYYILTFCSVENESLGSTFYVSYSFCGRGI